jgi:hypothetical protein
MVCHAVSSDTKLSPLKHILSGTALCFRGQEKPMTSNETGGPISDVLALATRTADSGNDLAIGSGQIIAKRVSLGLAAVVNPMAADLAEFARIVPEKVEAFSAAGIAMFEQSELVRNQITRFASDEVMTSARATIEMATCFTPIAMLEAQGRFAHAWWDRATSNIMALAAMTLNAQGATLGPLQVAVAANKERLA